MLKRLMTIGLAVAAVASVARAEPMRTFLTKEGKLPAVGSLELTASEVYTEIRDQREFFRPTDVDEWRTTLAARYGLAEALSLNVSVPFLSLSYDDSDADESGVGDVVAGLELMAFKDIFDYPYFMPYVEVAFPTGDEDKGLGEGDGSVVFGGVVGTTMNDVYHYAVDARYAIYQDDENVGSVGVSIGWDVSKQLTVLGEGIFVEKRADEDTNAKIVQGGFAYKPAVASNWLLSFHGGKELDGARDVIAGARVSYTFE